MECCNSAIFLVSILLSPYKESKIMFWHRDEVGQYTQISESNLMKMDLLSLVAMAPQLYYQINVNEKREFSLTEFRKLEIEHLNLSVRAFNCLMSLKLRTVGEILDADLLNKTHRLGSVTLKEIKTAILAKIPPDQTELDIKPLLDELK